MSKAPAFSPGWAFTWGLTWDRLAEVIFQNTAGGAGVKPGTTFYADMKTGVAQWGVVTASVDGNWEVQGTADVDNDGSADVLFQHATTGAALYADMNAIAPATTRIGTCSARATSMAISRFRDSAAAGER